MSKIYRALITGGGGMLAQALVRALGSRGHQITALDRTQLDVTDLMAVGRAFEKYAPALVLNCAAYTKVDSCEEQKHAALEVNATAIVTLANLVSINGAKLVHYSTDFVFDGTASTPYSVDALTNPLSEYGRS